MKFIVAPDSFKGSLSALEAANAIANGILAIYPDAQIDKIPVADGGEGTVEALIYSTSGQFVELSALDPLGREIKTKYGILGDSKTVAIEMSATSGITLLKNSELDPLKTTTYGTGQLIKHALDIGYRQFLIGIGGSATNDGGTGMAQGLGVKFINSDHYEIKEKMCGGLLDQVANIDIDSIHPAVKESTFKIASDVNNPLLGVEGCTEVYAQQKGASLEALILLEKNMTNFVNIAENTFGASVRELSGAGAAGGFGAGAVLFLKAEIESGIDIVLKSCNFENRIKNANLIITGEGKIDNQTRYGKTITGVAHIAKNQNTPVIAFAGVIDRNINLERLGILNFYSINKKGMSIEVSMKKASTLLQNEVENAIKSLGL